MDYTEAKLRIIRKLPDDFLSDNKNREALSIFEQLFTTAELEEIKRYETTEFHNPWSKEIIDKINKGELPALRRISGKDDIKGLDTIK